MGSWDWFFPYVALTRVELRDPARVLKLLQVIEFLDIAAVQSVHWQWNKQVVDSSVS